MILLLLFRKQYEPFGLTSKTSPLQVNYKSDLNWIKGVGWTPPGSHKAELARRAAELGLAEGCSTDEAIAKYQQMMMVS